MKKRGLIYYITCALFAVACALAGGFCEWDKSVLLLPSSPFALLGEAIRSLVLNGNAFWGYAVYILFGALPLVFPIVCLCRKRLRPRMLLWLVLSGYIYTMMYFMVNPHLLYSRPAADIGASAEVQSGFVGIAQAAMTATLVLLFLLAVLPEFGALIDRKEFAAYRLSKAILFLMALVVIFGVCFVGVLGLRQTVASVLEREQTELAAYVSVNLFVAGFSFAANWVPAVFAVLLVGRALGFLSAAQRGVFESENLPRLNRLIGSARGLLYAEIATLALVNAVKLICGGSLFDAQYEYSVPVLLILAICLIIVFSKVLAKGISLSEESKLVI